MVRASDNPYIATSSNEKIPLEDVATKMAETYDKEVKALNIQQDNNAKAVYTDGV